MDHWITETHRGVRLSFETEGEPLYHAESPYQTVDIVNTKAFGKMLLLDGMVMTTDKDEFVYHEMISHVPMMVHPNPKRVLVIGGGDGGTIRELVKHPELERAVLCEIDGLVVESCKTHMPQIGAQFEHPKVEVIIGDGVAYMAEQARDFDLIIIDSTDPIGPGEGLFTEEFYRNVFKALKPDGLMVAQTESPFATPDIIKKVYPMYHRIFPVVRMYTGHIPTYPSGFWTWAFCSKQYTPELPPAHYERADKIAKTCRYYNRALHDASFALPNFVQDLLQQPASVS